MFFRAISSYQRPQKVYGNKLTASVLFICTLPQPCISKVKASDRVRALTC